MEGQQIEGTAVPDAATMLPGTAADQSQPGAESWDARAEACLRNLWHFFNRKVIDLHGEGRLTEAAELSDVREQVHALLRERPQPSTVPAESADLHHPLTQLAEGSGLPASDDPDTYMPSLP